MQHRSSWAPSARGSRSSRAFAVAATLHLAPLVMAVPPATRLVTRRSAGRREPGALALTFDDGPHPDGTSAVMDVLATFGVTATFFLIGEQVQLHPGVAREILGRGHGLGVHGWRHRLLPAVGPIATVQEIRRTHHLIAQVTGVRPRWYRPPYGAATGPALAAARALGMAPVWWTSHGRDWSERDPTAVARRILRVDRHQKIRLDERDVLLLHDSDRYARTGSWQVTVDALPHVLTGLRDAGLIVGPLPDR